MNYSTNRFTLDLQSSVSQISIPIPLGDTARVFEISLSDGGRPYTIEDGCLALVSIKDPNGNIRQHYCPITNNTTVVYKFSEHKNTAVFEGLHNCDVTIYTPEETSVASAKFSMVVK